MQTAGALLLDNMTNGLVLNRAKLPGIDFTAGKLQTGLFNSIRA